MNICLRKANLLTPGNSSTWIRVPSSRVSISRRPAGRLVLGGAGALMFAVAACASAQHSANNTVKYSGMRDGICAGKFQVCAR